MRTARPTVRISIHAPREGSDLPVTLARDRQHVFQSTLPARGATGSLRRKTRYFAISIHAPREGSDRISTNCDRK